MTTALEGGEWSAAHPDRTLPPGKTQYPFQGGRVGPRAGLDGQNISSPLDFSACLMKTYYLNRKR